jgi:hypothetical protein
MRSSTSIAFLALSALAAPTISLAAPTYAKRSSEPVYARDEATSSLLAREVRSNDESGAILPALLLGAASIIPSFFKGKREDLEAREPIACFTKECFDRVQSNPGMKWKSVGGREFDELLARAAEDESGAFWPALIGALAPTVINMFRGKREFDEVFTREFEQDLLARAEADESGAFWPAVIGALAPAVINMFRGKREFDEVFTREFEQDLLARAAEDESGAFWPALIGALAPTVINMFRGKREFQELMARAEEDESGAFWPALIGGAISLFSSLRGKREFEEVFAREFGQDLLARSDEESGAFWPALIGGAISLFSSLRGKREFEELLAREPVFCQTQQCFDMVSKNPGMMWASVPRPTRPFARSLTELD